VKNGSVTNLSDFSNDPVHDQDPGFTWQSIQWILGGVEHDIVF